MNSKKRLKKRHKKPIITTKKYLRESKIRGMGAEIFFAFKLFIIKNGLLKTVVPIKFQLSTVKLKFHGAFHVSLLFYY